MVTEQIYAYDDLSAEIQCIVQGYPEPKVEWHYRKSPNAARTDRLNDPVLVKTTALNQYLHTLLVCFFRTFFVEVNYLEIESPGTEICAEARCDFLKFPS